MTDPLTDPQTLRLKPNLKPEQLAFFLKELKPYIYRFLDSCLSRIQKSETINLPVLSQFDYKLYLPSVDLDSKITEVMESAKIEESDDLVWTNRKIVVDERPQKCDSHHGSRRLDPRPSSNCYSISSSDGEL